MVFRKPEGMMIVVVVPSLRGDAGVVSLFLFVLFALCFYEVRET